jgi:S1-C subfamily serine protease
MKNLKLLFCAILFFIENIAFADIDNKIIERAKKASVAIYVDEFLVPYDPIYGGSGSGFIVDKERGLIVTNNHISGKGGVFSYELTFENGKKADAMLLYFDLWQDFAILKVDPKEIPSDAFSLEFSKNDPKYGDEVFIVGNAGGQNLSIHTGYITSLYSIRGFLPQQAYVVNLNRAGGSSGSPLMNKDGKVIGVHFSGSESYGNSVNGKYVKYALDYLIKNQMPIRNHIGVVCELISLDGISNYLDSPEELHKEYEKLDPAMRRKVLAVAKTITNSQADKFLEPGDVIWKANGKMLGASLYDLDQAMNESKDKINLEIYRRGEKLNFDIDLYDINKNKVRKMIEFAGGVFFLSDDYNSAITGIPIGQINIVNLGKNSFKNIMIDNLNIYPCSQCYTNFAIIPLKIDGQDVNNLENLKEILPEIIKKKRFNFVFKNLGFYEIESQRISSPDRLNAFFNLGNFEHSAKYYYLDEKLLEWKSENIE